MSGNGPAEEDGGTAEAGTPPAQDIHREKPVGKVVRVLTVMAYLLSVSMAAILLSVYYICVWKSPELPKLNDAKGLGFVSAMRGDHNDYEASMTSYAPYNFTGGSNTPMNYTNATTLNSNYTTYPSESTESTLNITETESTSDDIENSSSEPAEETEDFIATTIT